MTTNGLRKTTCNKRLVLWPEISIYTSTLNLADLSSRAESKGERRRLQLHLKLNTSYSLTRDPRLSNNFPDNNSLPLIKQAVALQNTVRILTPIPSIFSSLRPKHQRSPAAADRTAQLENSRQIRCDVHGVIHSIDGLSSSFPRSAYRRNGS